MSESRQPTHHGYAVNVKDHERYTYEEGSITWNEFENLYDSHVSAFWNEAEEIAHDYGFTHLYSEGRMGGYATPYPQPATDDMWDSELEAWMLATFRPFERDILGLMEEARADFLSELQEAQERADREPAERAYWEACDVMTID